MSAKLEALNLRSSNCKLSYDRCNIKSFYIKKCVYNYLVVHLMPCGTPVAEHWPSD